MAIIAFSYQMSLCSSSFLYCVSIEIKSVTTCIRQYIRLPFLVNRETNYVLFPDFVSLFVGRCRCSNITPFFTLNASEYVEMELQLKPFQIMYFCSLDRVQMWHKSTRDVWTPTHTRAYTQNNLISVNILKRQLYIHQKKVIEYEHSKKAC